MLSRPPLCWHRIWRTARWRSVAPPARFEPEVKACNISGKTMESPAQPNAGDPSDGWVGRAEPRQVDQAVTALEVALAECRPSGRRLDVDQSRRCQSVPSGSRTWTPAVTRPLQSRCRFFTCRPRRPPVGARRRRAPAADRRWEHCAGPADYELSSVLAGPGRSPPAGWQRRSRPR